MQNDYQRRWLLVLVILMATGMHCFYSYVFFPARIAEDALMKRPRGNFSDLYPVWLGTRDLLLNQHDPYSPEVTADIQKGVWGRTVDSRKPGDPTDESRFAYPLYVVFILAPMIVIPFPAATALFIVLGLIAGSLSAWFWSRLLGRGNSVFHVIITIVLFLGSWPFVLALRVHQPALIVFALMSGAMMAVVAQRPWIAGVLLALATIKPQSVIGIVGWLLLWSLSNWKDRKGVLVSFGLTLSAMLGAAEFLVPGWFWEWREAMSAYMRYSPLTGAFVELMFGHLLGKIVGVLVVFGTVLFCWKARKDTPDTNRFKLAPALILSANLFVTPVWHAYDHIFLLPPAILLWEWREQFFQLKPFQRAVVRFSALALIWQWFGVAVAVCIVIIAPSLALKLRILPYFTVLLLPPLALASLILIGRARLCRSLVPAATNKP
jgi:Glycosyltransferase family 87